MTESKQGLGGRSGEAKSEPSPKKDAEPKPPTPRYAEGKEVVKLAERTLAARQVVGRNRLAELLETTGSAVWRWENGRIHPDEVGDLDNRLDAVEDRINRGEFVKQERQPKGSGPSKAELAHRVEEAVKYLRGGTSGSGKSVAQAVLAILHPPTQQ